LERHLHIVSFDVPYPPDYGGVIPIFSLLKSLKDAGIAIHLHCFEYGRGQQPHLNQYCHEVIYYKRRDGIRSFSLRLPYIVSSRINPQLRLNLLKDDHPILFEGVHCSYLALDAAFRQRSTAMRLHNVEFKYYRQLYRTSSEISKRIYYYFESRLLKKYESSLAKAARIITLSGEDRLIYQRLLGARNITFLPMVIPYTEIKSQPGLGTYCLYHGNLAVPENEMAASWLSNKVFNDVPTPLIIAGKNPSSRLKKIIQSFPNQKLIENPDEKEMQELISAAQINVLPSFNSTGIKLKFLNALFNGRHCIVNAAMACATQVVSLCHVADDEKEFKALISKLSAEPFSEEEIRNRKEILKQIYDNPINTQSLVQWIC
jgi:Glycosyl transferases group 1